MVHCNRAVNCDAHPPLVSTLAHGRFVPGAGASLERHPVAPSAYCGSSSSSSAVRQRNMVAAAGEGRAQRSLDTHSSLEDGRRTVAAAAERNKEAILHGLQRYLGQAHGLLLEVASGTGQHAAHCAAGLPTLSWQPTEADPGALPSIAAWGEGVPNVVPPRLLDVEADPPEAWCVAPASCAAVFAANLCHISPWAATAGLVAGAARALSPGGLLLIYGPFSVDGRPTTESNAAFDASLRARNPEWGYRDVAQVAAAGAAVGLALVAREAMPANNFMLVLRQKQVAT